MARQGADKTTKARCFPALGCKPYLGPQTGRVVAKRQRCAMQGRDSSNKAKAKTMAVRIAAAVQSIETLQNLAAFGRWDTEAVVHDA